MSTPPQPIATSRPIMVPVPTSLVTEASYIVAEACLGSLQPGGTYVSRDLYLYYAEVCREEGVPPLTPNRYGRHLKKLGLVPGRDSTGTRRTWWIPEA